MVLTFSITLAVPINLTASNQPNSSTNVSIVKRGNGSNGEEWGIEWDKTFGGENIHDKGYWVEQTADGGYIITGDTYWASKLVKTNENGDKEWERNIGSDYSTAYCVRQASDGGYIITGAVGAGAPFDVWLFKTNGYGWEKSYGGTSEDVGYSVLQASDGGYLIVGDTKSYGVVDSSDVWILKTDSFGYFSWSYVYGGLEDFHSRCVENTSDGGYIITGYYMTASDGYNVFLLKIDSSGNFVGERGFGGQGDDLAKCVVQTSDGGYIIVGDTESYGADGKDVLLIKTDGNGNEKWIKTYGGADTDEGNCVVQTSDGGYIITGSTRSYGAGGEDVWLIKTDENSDKEWDKTFGEEGEDIGRCVRQTTDGGYIIAGWKGCQSEMYYGYRSDFWLIKVSYGYGEDGLLDNEIIRYGIIIGIISLTVGMVTFLITLKGRVKPDKISEYEYEDF